MHVSKEISFFFNQNSSLKFGIKLNIINVLFDILFMIVFGQDENIFYENNHQNFMIRYWVLIGWQKKKKKKDWRDDRENIIRRRHLAVSKCMEWRSRRRWPPIFVLYLKGEEAFIPDMRRYRFDYPPTYMRDRRFPIVMLFVFLNMYANQ